MIDWSAMVAQAVAKLPETGPKSADSDPTARNIAPCPDKLGTAETRATTGFAGGRSEFPTDPTQNIEAKDQGREICTPSSFIEPAGGTDCGGIAPRQTPADGQSKRCLTCAHRRRPGLSEGYCAGRDDLTPAYTLGHPLRQCPPDDGAGCTAWRLHPYQ